MGTYDKPAHEICVDKTSCRHELSSEGKPVKQQGTGVPADKKDALKEYRQSQDESKAGGPQKGS